MSPTIIIDTSLDPTVAGGSDLPSYDSSSKDESSIWQVLFQCLAAGCILCFGLKVMYIRLGFCKKKCKEAPPQTYAAKTLKDALLPSCDSHVATAMLTWRQRVRILHAVAKQMATRLRPPPIDFAVKESRVTSAKIRLAPDLVPNLLCDGESSLPPPVFNPSSSFPLFSAIKNALPSAPPLLLYAATSGSSEEESGGNYAPSAPPIAVDIAFDEVDLRTESLLKDGYMCPEALEKGGLFDEKTDVFAFGIVMLESMTGNVQNEKFDVFERYHNAPDGLQALMTGFDKRANGHGEWDRDVQIQLAALCFSCLSRRDQRVNQGGLLLALAQIEKKFCQPTAVEREFARLREENAASEERLKREVVASEEQRRREVAASEKKRKREVAASEEQRKREVAANDEQRKKEVEASGEQRKREEYLRRQAEDEVRGLDRRLQTLEGRKCHVSECATCFESNKQGFVCSGGHVLCWGPAPDDNCLVDYVRSCARPDAQASSIDKATGRVRCPNLGCVAFIDPFGVAKAGGKKEIVDLLVKIEADAKTASALQEELAKQERRLKQETERILAIQDLDERKAEILCRKIREDELNYKCPRCKRAFIFDTSKSPDDGGNRGECLAFKCQSKDCRAGFCGWCFQDCGDDAHPHVRSCREGNGGLFDLTQEQKQFDNHHRAKRESAIRAITSKETKEVQAHIQRLLEKDLSPLGIRL